MRSVGALSTLLCVLGSGIINYQNVAMSAGLTLGQSQRLHCFYVEEKLQSTNEEVVEPKLVRRKAQLLLSNTGISHLEGSPHEVITFIVRESSINLLKHVDENTDKLECEIRLYSTQGIQVEWPGLRIGEDAPYAWFTSTIKHTDGKFKVTAFFRLLSSTLNQESDDQQSQRLTIGDSDTLQLTGVYIVSTRTPSVQTNLRKGILLDCTFTVDHETDVTIEWRFQQKGTKKKIFSYSGLRKQVEHIEEGIEVFLNELPKGNASLLIRDIAMKDEGTYVCSVYVPPLYEANEIKVEILEHPTVTLNTDFLSLMEGDEEKLTCDIARYYPLDVQVQWLREYEGERLLPHVVKNVLFSSHKHNSDGTFSISSFFWLKAFPKDDGVKYTCRVEHKSLKTAIRKSVLVKVTGQPQHFFMALSIILILVFIVLLIFLLYHLHKVKSNNKKKPY